ncbi:MAG: hypothetical protein PHS82_10140 [Lachnospiraceae bacterium]|nr:hypothetical protein [Lachnospiraceae bacterium]
MCTRFVHNGNVGTLLYVNGNEKGEYIANKKCRTISELTNNLKDMIYK